MATAAAMPMTGAMYLLAPVGAASAELEVGMSVETKVEVMEPLVMTDVRVEEGVGVPVMPPDMDDSVMEPLMEPEPDIIMVLEPDIMVSEPDIMVSEPVIIVAPVARGLAAVSVSRGLTMGLELIGLTCAAAVAATARRAAANFIMAVGFVCVIALAR